MFTILSKSISVKINQCIHSKYLQFSFSVYSKRVVVEVVYAFVRTRAHIIHVVSLNLSEVLEVLSKILLMIHL